MPMVTVSKRFRIPIPKELRERLKIRPGQQLHMYVQDDAIRVSVPRPITELRGIAKGIRWRPEDRDHTERF